MVIDRQCDNELSWWPAVDSWKKLNGDSSVQKRNWKVNNLRLLENTLVSRPIMRYINTSSHLW